jgi:hypothetical protein
MGRAASKVRPGAGGLQLSRARRRRRLAAAALSCRAALGLT